MLLYFLRHADASPDAGSDFDRVLTPKGLEQAEKVGKFCTRCGLAPEIILTSPVVRARQTAEIVASRLGGVELIHCHWLACGMSPETCLSELKGFERFSSLLLVGHEPDFGETLAALIDLNCPSGLKVRKASLSAVEIPHLKPAVGELQFSLPVRLM